MSPSASRGRLSDDLAIHDRIRLHRDRLGLTQEEAAGLAGVSVSLWRKWESGARTVARFSQLIDIAQALRIVDLRALTGQPLAVSADGQPRHEATADVRAALLRHPALNAPSGDDTPGLDALAVRVDRAWDVAQSASPWRYAHTGALLPGLLADVDTGSDSRRAARLAVMTYLLARAWTKWVGETDLALVAAERGLAVAARSDDPALTGAAAWNYAQAVSTLGHPEQVATTVDDALGLVGPRAGRPDASPRLLSAAGALHLIGMVGAVRVEDRRGGQQHLRHAAEYAARLGEDRNDWRTAFGPTNVAIHRVAYAVELGQSRTAVRGAGGVPVDRAPSVERRVSHLLDVSRSHVLLREDRPALEALSEADRQSPEQVSYSPTARESVRVMLRRETASTRPLLRPLAVRLRVA